MEAQATTLRRTSPPRSVPRLNADTSSQPEGVTRRVVLSVLEAFFRRPWLHLLPLILLTAVGVATAVNHDERFRSEATMYATDDSLLSDVTATNNAPFTYETPAQRAAGQLGLLLSTDPFLLEVAAQAGVPIGGEHDQLKLGELRSSVATTVAGDSLLQVSATTDFPELSRRLADATVQTYIDYVARTNVQEGKDTEESIDSLVRDARKDLNTANNAVKAYFEQHPNAVGAGTDPVLAQELLLRQLEFERAEERYSTARAAQDKAGLEGGTASEVVRQRYALFVPALAPQDPEPVLRAAMLTVAVFIVLGALLSLASTVAAAMLDRTIRVPEDIRTRFGLEVLAVVPDASR